MYEVGDRVFLEENYGRFLNRPLYRGKEVKIIAIDKNDWFLPYCVKSVGGEVHWIDKEVIKAKVAFLGIKVWKNYF